MSPTKVEISVFLKVYTKRKRMLDVGRLVEQLYVFPSTSGHRTLTVTKPLAAAKGGFLMMPPIGLVGYGRGNRRPH